MSRYAALAAVLFGSVHCAAQEPEPLRTWIDASTGHRVIRLTDEPNSASLYFNQNGYTADSRKMVYTTPQGIATLDLETRTAKPLVTGRVRVIVAGRKTQNAYYIKNGAVFATDADTGATQLGAHCDR